MRKRREVLAKRTEILSGIQAVFEDVTGIHDMRLTLDTSLYQEGVLSSFAVIQLACAIEEKFDIIIPNSVLCSFKTVKDIVDFINKE